MSVRFFGATSLIKVHSLELSRNNITNAGAIALVGHAKFSRLDLSWNLAIGDETGRCVAQFANQIYLDLTGCTISETILAQANSRIEANMSKFQAEIKLQSEKKPHRSGAHEFFPPNGKSRVVEEFKEHSSVQKLT